MFLCSSLREPEARTLGLQQGNRPLGAPCHPQNTSPRPCPLPPGPSPAPSSTPGLSFPAGLGRGERSELLLLAFAFAVPCQVFPLPALPRKQRTALVVCGPEQNGAVGLACARHLRVFEYEPTIFYPTRSADPLHRDLTTQCEKMDIPFLSYLPAEVQLINNAYRLVVDAVLGPGVEPAEVGGPCTRALATLKLLSIPLVSLDIPSGTPGGGGARGAGRWAWAEACLPTRACFLTSDGFYTLGKAEGHVHPLDGQCPAWRPGDPGSLPFTPCTACPLPILAQSPRQT